MWNLRYQTCSKGQAESRKAAGDTSRHWVVDRGVASLGCRKRLFEACPPPQRQGLLGEESQKGALLNATKLRRYSLAEQCFAEFFAGAFHEGVFLRSAFADAWFVSSRALRQNFQIA